MHFLHIDLDICYFGILEVAEGCLCSFEGKDLLFINGLGLVSGILCH
ncbi:hypothetical protein GbCGDNIH6_10013 [Granulibacter bethesdensis]|nr:hypothetical protein GbCGDNIH6_10013 [Granulibacter bethesdensis]